MNTNNQVRIPTDLMQIIIQCRLVKAFLVSPAGGIAVKISICILNMNILKNIMKVKLFNFSLFEGKSRQGKG